MPLGEELHAVGMRCVRHVSIVCLNQQGLQIDISGHNYWMSQFLSHRLCCKVDLTSVIKIYLGVLTNCPHTPHDACTPQGGVTVSFHNMRFGVDD